MTKVIDRLTQEDFHRTFYKLLERYNKCIAARRRLLRKGLEFPLCTINKSVHTKKSGNLLKAPPTVFKALWMSGVLSKTILLDIVIY